MVAVYSMKTNSIQILINEIRQEKRQTSDRSLYDHCNVGPKKAQSLSTGPIIAT